LKITGFSLYSIKKLLNEIYFMSGNIKTTIAIISIALVIFTAIAGILYKNFFKKIDINVTHIPAAEVVRFSEPVELPSFRFINQQHKFVNIKQFKGKITLVNFWATWCLPCVKELPQLESLLEVFGKDNINIIPISIDSDKTIEKLIKFVNSININNLKIYQDKNLEAYELTHSLGVPTTLVLDSNLKLHFKVSGYFNWKNPEILGLLSQLP